MKLVSVAASLSALVICSNGWLAAFALGNGGTPNESVEAFLQRYYQSIPKAKTLQDMEVFYTPAPKDEKTKALIDNPLIARFILQQLQNEPTKVKILSKTEKNGALYLDVAPEVMPKKYQDDSQQPGFTIKGSVVVVKADNGWLVHKDYWSVHTKSKSGEMTESFGRNPPEWGTAGSDNRPGANTSAAATSATETATGAPPTVIVESPKPPQGYDDMFLARFKSKWHPTGKGKQFAAMKVTPDGKLEEMRIGGKDAAGDTKELVQALKDAQPFPPLPPDLVQKPFVWMQLFWTSDGVGSSGPYFDDKIPESIGQDMHPI